LERCWNDGWKARQRGEPEACNPYQYGSDDWEAWRGGWLDLDQHEKDKDEAMRSIAW
jgi:hypothetical protein